MIYYSRPAKLLAAALFLQMICLNGLVFSQSPSAKSVQMDADWDKIRDAQVQMLRKKEAELDRIKEELLTRTQPQARIQTGLPEVEAEFKKREADWLQKSDRYENEVTLLKVKVEEQKHEIDELRLKLNDFLKKQPTSGQEKFLDQKPLAVAALNVSADLERRDFQLKLQEKQLQDKQAEWEIHSKQFQQAKEEFSRLEKEKVEFQNKISNWEASQLQVNQKNEAERLQIKKDQQAIDAQKTALEKSRIDLANEEKLFAAKVADLKGTSVHAQELLKREAAIQAREQQLNQKQSAQDEREKRITDIQRQTDEEKRLWLSQKAQVDQSLSQKLADTEGKLVTLQDASRAYEFDRKKFAKQIADLQEQIRAEKSVSAEQQLNLKKREQELLMAQSGGNSKTAELQARLSKLQMDFSQKEHDWKAQIISATQKLEQKQTQLKEVDLQLERMKTQAANQKDDREKEWAKQVAEFEKKSTGLSSFEIELNKKSVALEAQALHLEDKSKALSQEQEEFSNQMREGSLSTANSQGSSEILELKQMLERTKKENDSWRQSKRQVEQNWADFVNKEMQYQMQISELQKENQKLQKKMEVAMLPQSAPQSQSDNGSLGGRRIVDERRALEEEKVQLYRQFTRDRQSFEQAQIQFSRQQREFERYVQDEQVRLEKLRRQAASSSR